MKPCSWYMGLAWFISSSNTVLCTFSSIVCSVWMRSLYPWISRSSVVIIPSRYWISLVGLLRSIMACSSSWLKLYPSSLPISNISGFMVTLVTTFFFTMFFFPYLFVLYFFNASFGRKPPFIWFFIMFTIGSGVGGLFHFGLVMPILILWAYMSSTFFCSRYAIIFGFVPFFVSCIR